MPIRMRTVHGSRPALVMLVVGLATAVPVSAQDGPRFPGDPMSGQRLFSQEGCVRCHSIWGNGGNLGPDLGEVGLGRSLMQLAGMFWNHTPRMIETVESQGFEWPTFADKDLADIISYIYYVKLFDPPGDPRLGRQWFSDKRCIECHTVGGSGGSVGPALDEYANHVAALPLAAGMWNHGAGMRANQVDRGVPLPQFFGSELSDIQAFIREASTLRRRKLSLMEPPDLSRGVGLFRSKGCVACHGMTGRGTSLAPDLRMAIQQLRASEIAGEMWNHSDRITNAMVRNGAALPQFTEAELADVISYLYYLRYEEMAGDEGAGRQVFQRSGCSRCHALDGTQSVGPNLAASPVVLDPISLSAAMWNHAPSMYTRVRQAGITWPLFQGDEMRDLAAYLRKLGEQ